jgi:hypothetical protein
MDRWGKILGVRDEFLILGVVNTRKDDMKVSLADHGLYYRGLLVLVRRDRKIDEAERDMLMRVGKALGFEETFCAQAIREILENEYIPDEPPHFDNQELARCFLRDGIRLAWADRNIDGSELSFLKSVGALHGIDEPWLEQAIEQITREEQDPLHVKLEAEGLQWK